MNETLTLDLTVPLDSFTLSVRWESSPAFLGIFGRSGAGKTTLLETIAGLRKDARGIIRLGGATWLDSARGVRLPAEKRGVGYVPQEMLLFPHRDVMGNLRAGRRRAARPSARAIPLQRVVEVLDLGDLVHRRIGSLSGGEKRRVALGRALCSAPDLLLLDEPLAGLDLPLRRRIIPYLMRVREEFGIPTVCVSHDATEIRMLGDEVAVLESGRIIARGAPAEVFTRPEILPLARAEGFENVLIGRVVEIAESAALVELEPGLPLMVPGGGLTPGLVVSVGVRAEDLILAVRQPSGISARNSLPGVIREVRAPAAGDDLVAVVVSLGKEAIPVVAAVTPQARRDLELRPGLDVTLIAKTHSCHVLAARRTAGL